MRHGLTLIEVLVAIAIIAILAAVIIPGVLYARESVRRLECKSHLRQIGVAIGSYTTTHRVLPPGAYAQTLSLHTALLPYLDQSPLHKQIDFTKWGSEQPSAVQQAMIPVFLCPSDSAPSAVGGGDRSLGCTSYASNFGTGVQRYGFNGAFRNLNFRKGHPRLSGYLSPADVVDGLSQTAAMCEILHADGTWSRLRVNWNTPRRLAEPDELELFRQMCEDLPADPYSRGWLGNAWGRGRPWTDGNLSETMYNHILGPNRPSCINGTDVPTMASTAASSHAGGVNLLFLDGRVEFIADGVDLKTWRDFGSRSQSRSVFD